MVDLFLPRRPDQNEHLNEHFFTFCSTWPVGLGLSQIREISVFMRSRVFGDLKMRDQLNYAIKLGFGILYRNLIRWDDQEPLD